MRYIPKLSVVITSYNRKNVLLRCINSILSQTEKSYEIILVDDFSNDGTKEYIESLDIPNFRYIRTEKNLGLGLGPMPVRRVGALNSRANWVLVLDSDDQLVDGALNIVCESIRLCPNDVGVINFLAVDQNSNNCGELYEKNDVIIATYPEIIGKTKASGEFIKCVRREIFECYNDKDVIVPNSVFWGFAAKKSNFMYINKIVRIYNKDHGKTGDGVGGIRNTLHRAPYLADGLQRFLDVHEFVLSRFPFIKYRYIAELSIQSGLAGRRLNALKSFSKYIFYSPERKIYSLIQMIVYFIGGGRVYKWRHRM